MFLVTIRSPTQVTAADRKAAMGGKRDKRSKRSDRSQEDAYFLEEYGVVTVRGCEVYEVDPPHTTGH